MSTKDLSPLTPDEVGQLREAFPYITVLIAGCDGKIEPKELEWAVKIVHIRTFAGDESLDTFHEEVQADFTSKVSELIATLPAGTSERNTMIAEKLSELNPILAKLDPEIGTILYKGYKSFAERIAKSAGGFLSFFSIGPEEKKWIGLPMLQEIIHMDDDEEAE